MPVTFGQLVIGPPGSGKSTYCNEISKYLKEIGRKVAVINIDPANDSLNYDAAVNIYDLITVEDVMNHKKLGPNGGLIFAMEYLEENLDWLLTEIKKLKDTYLIFDCPGQIELYTHHRSVKKVMLALQESKISLCVVNLLDSHYCSDAGKFISALLITLSTMLHMELPHINVLSKVDMLLTFSEKLPFNLEFYTEVLDLHYLLDSLDEDKFTKKYQKLNAAMVDLVQDYSLVSFLPLNIKDKRMLNNLRKAFDKANGYVFNSGEERNVHSLLACAVGAETDQDRLGVDSDLYSSMNENANPLCFQQTGIRVLAIAPSLTDTPILGQLERQTSLFPELHEKCKERIHQLHLQKPESVANCLIHLLKGDAESGSIWLVEGDSWRKICFEKLLE